MRIHTKLLAAIAACTLIGLTCAPTEAAPVNVETHYTATRTCIMLAPASNRQFATITFTVTRVDTPSSSTYTSTAFRVKVTDTSAWNKATAGHPEYLGFQASNKTATRGRVATLPAGTRASTMYLHVAAHASQDTVAATFLDNRAHPARQVCTVDKFTNSSFRRN